DRRADLVQQRQNGIAVQHLLQGEILDGWHLRREKLVEDGIRWRPLSRPLRMQMRLWPQVVTFGSHKASFGLFKIDPCRLPVNIILVRGPTSSWLVDYVHCITLAQEELCPAFTTIWCSSEVGSGLTSAVDHDDRPRVCLPARDLELGIEVPSHDSPTLHGR